MESEAEALGRSPLAGETLPTSRVIQAGSVRPIPRPRPIEGEAGTAKDFVGLSFSFWTASALEFATVAEGSPPEPITKVVSGSLRKKSLMGDSSSASWKMPRLAVLVVSTRLSEADCAAVVEVEGEAETEAEAEALGQSPLEGETPPDFRVIQAGSVRPIPRPLPIKEEAGTAKAFVGLPFSFWTTGALESATVVEVSPQEPTTVSISVRKKSLVGDSSSASWKMPRLVIVVVVPMRPTEAD